MFRIRVEFLRSLDDSFWDKFHERVCWYGQTDRVQILMSSLIAHWPEAETSGGALKIMSKFGAVKAHRHVPMPKAYDNLRLLPAADDSPCQSVLDILHSKTEALVTDAASDEMKSGRLLSGKEQSEFADCVFQNLVVHCPHRLI